MLISLQRALALTALTMFVLLQVFGTVWHESAHAAEHAGSLSGLELLNEDHSEEEHLSLAEQDSDDHDGVGHMWHHALHSASHLFEHMQLFSGHAMTRVAETAQPAKWYKHAPLKGGTVDPLVPPPNA